MTKNDSPALEGENSRKAALEAEQAKWFTVEEAAFVLQTDRHTVLKSIHAGHLHLFAMGKVWRIHADSLNRAQKSLDAWQPTPAGRFART